MLRLAKPNRFLTWRIPSRSLTIANKLSEIPNHLDVGKQINSELLDYWKAGQVPEKFNFSRDIFDKHAIHRPYSNALLVDSENNERKEWSFSEVREESIRSAIFLRRILNPIRNPYIFTLLPRIPEWWFFYLASIRIGAVFSPGTTMLTHEDIEYRLQASKAAVVITDSENVAKVEEASRKLDFNVNKVVVGEVSASFVLGDWINYKELAHQISDKEIEVFKNADTRSDQIAHCYFTSGTTGRPKMVAHTHSSYGIGHYTTAKMLGLESSDLHWNISDPGWAKSAFSSFFAPWISGSTVYINQMKRFEGKRVLETLKRREITTFCAPPTLYKSMIKQEDLNLFKFANLRFCMAAGEPLAPEVARVWKERTGITLHQFYGQTEMGVIDCTNSGKEGSIGLPSGLMDLRVLDGNGREVPANTEGQIALKLKPNRPIGLLKGYMKPGRRGPIMDKEKNASVFMGDFYFTGDQGFKDEEGHVFILGRVDDVINSSGYRIGPIEVEAVLQSHPAVVESAAVSSPDPLRQEVVKAFITLTPAYKEIAKLNESKLKLEIQEHVKLHTAPYKYPRKIEFVDSLPKTISGKILRRVLKVAEYEKCKGVIC